MIYNQINNLIVILFFGSLVMLAFINITNPLKINIRGNQWFAAFLLLMASFWLEEIAELTGIGKISPIILLFVHSLQILAPTTLYLSTLFYTQPDYNITKRDWIHSIIPLSYLFIKVSLFLRPDSRPTINVLGIVLIFIQALFYGILAYIRIRKHQKRILLYSSNTQGINLNWLEYITIQLLTLCVIILLYNIFVSSTTPPNLLINSIQLITVFVIAHFSLKQKEIFPVKEDIKNELLLVTKSEDDTTEKKKILSDDDLRCNVDRLKKLMTEQKPHLDGELNLVKLSNLLSVTPHHLSYTINTGFNENFFQFVNRYRVKEAKDLLKKADEKMTMVAVAFDSGFNSKTSFNTTFKKMTGQTPSEYKKEYSNL
jgi:AraC-like DNA-binding protein